MHSRLGEDSTVVDFGDSVAVLSTDPITGAAQNQGWLGVHVSCNDIAAMGAAPIGVLVTLLLAESASPADVGRIMGEVHRASEELGIEVLGGHSEVTPGRLLHNHLAHRDRSGSQVPVRHLGWGADRETRSS